MNNEPDKTYDEYEREYQEWADSWYDVEFAEERAMWKLYHDVHDTYCEYCNYDYMRDVVEPRYDHLWPNCGPYCFCSRCCSARDCVGDLDEYDAWRRAFPDLPWEEESWD